MKGKKIYRYPSPCLSCTRVPHPEDCENKNCNPWQQWFLDQWELIHRFPRAHMEKAELKPAGVRVGGRYYAPPYQVEEYLRKDPCEACVCAGSVCTSPCRIRRSWEEAREEASR